jgi:hypothetical protein
MSSSERLAICEAVLAGKLTMMKRDGDVTSSNVA